jgi:hypothetical protein
MIDGHVDEYENAFLQDLSLSEFSHSLGHKRKSRTTILMSVKLSKAEVAHTMAFATATFHHQRPFHYVR